jgi:hypothetical protein
MDRSIKIVRQFEQVFELSRTIFKELKGKTIVPIANVSKEKLKTLEKSQIIVFWGRSVIR